ncbi:ABC transporter I family member 1 [Zea mays]|uniref:ABC transporter I family member 1 n=2 Tax=Zea mays TaxID=4577 RepID=A0A1D6DXP2_MAIZE|nr:ABC transporter I family member 1 [Zea mays]
MPPRLLLNNVSCMRNAQTVLRDINLSVHDGTALVLTGANGSGKTTLLRMLAGFSRPLAGEILWNGHDITSPGVFQQYKLQLNWMSLKDAVKEKLTVLENVQWFELLEGKDGSRSGPAIQLMELGRLINEKARRMLSMGQRKRLQLARLLAIDRPIWLLDEPSVALDAEGTRLLEHIIAEHREKGGIVFVATHLPIQNLFERSRLPGIWNVDLVALPSVITIEHVKPIFDASGTIHMYELSYETPPDLFDLGDLRDELYFKAFVFPDPSTTGSYIVVLIHEPRSRLSFARPGDDKWTSVGQGFSRPSAGEILWNGHDITSPGVFQQYKLQLNWMSLKDAMKEKLTVLENVQWFELLEGKDSSRSGPAIQLMGLGRLMNEKARRMLSMGQRKRLQLARLLAIDRPIWLLDEPSVALDAAGTRLLEHIIAEHREKGGIVFVAMHLPIQVEDSMSLRLPQRFPRRKTLVDLVH